MTPETPLNNLPKNSHTDSPASTGANVASDEAAAVIIVQLLDESAARLDKNTTAKLADARQQAVAVHVKSHDHAIEGNNGLLHLLATYFHDHRTFMSTAALGCAVLMAFLVTQQLVGGDVSEQGDASLLASDLPPEAYADKGFAIWLAQNSQR